LWERWEGATPLVEVEGDDSVGHHALLRMSWQHLVLVVEHNRCGGGVERISDVEVEPFVGPLLLPKLAALVDLELCVVAFDVLTTLADGEAPFVGEVILCSS